MQKSQSNLEEKDSPNILKDAFPSRIYTSLFISVVLELFKKPNIASFVLWM